MQKPSRKGEKTRGSIFESKGPISSWIQKRKLERNKKVEDAAKELSNNRAANENKMIAELESINFTSSLLPYDKIEYKSSETQPCGDLEFAVETAIGLIRNNTLDYAGYDLEKIDSLILVMISELKNAVIAGNVKRAFAAKAGVITAIDRIRNILPTVEEDMRQSFLEESEKYLEVWLTLISASTELDSLQNNLDNLNRSISMKTEEYESSLDAWAEKLKNDPEFQKKVAAIKNQSQDKFGDEWDQDSHDIYKWLVDQRIFKSSMDFERFRMSIVEKQFQSTSKLVEDLKTEVTMTPVPTDPDKLNKYKDMVDSVFEKAAKVDAEFAELGEFMDNVDERIRQMSSSKGNHIMDMMAAKSLEQLVKHAKELQLRDENLSLSNEERMNGIRELGLYTQEEMEIIKEQQAEQEAEMQAEMEQQRQQTHQAQKIREMN